MTLVVVSMLALLWTPAGPSPAPEQATVSCEARVIGGEDAAQCKRKCNSRCNGAQNKSKCVAECRRACDR
jgi:hypothetical protein